VTRGYRALKRIIFSNVWIFIKHLRQALVPRVILSKVLVGGPKAIIDFKKELFRSHELC